MDRWICLWWIDKYCKAVWTRLGGRTWALGPFHKHLVNCTKSFPIKLAFCGSSSPEKTWLGALSAQAKFSFAGPTRKSLGKRCWRMRQEGARGKFGLEIYRRIQWGFKWAKNYCWDWEVEGRIWCRCFLPMQPPSSTSQHCSLVPPWMLRRDPEKMMFKTTTKKNNEGKILWRETKENQVVLVGNSGVFHSWQLVGQDVVASLERLILMWICSRPVVFPTGAGMDR